MHLPGKCGRYLPTENKNMRITDDIYPIIFIILAIFEFAILNGNNNLLLLIIWSIVSCAFIYFYIRKRITNNFSLFCFLFLIVIMNVGLCVKYDDNSLTNKEFDYSVVVGQFVSKDYIAYKSGTDYYAYFKILGTHSQEKIPITKEEYYNTNFEGYSLISIHPYKIIKKNINEVDRIKNLYPVKYSTKLDTQEIGNNSYEYFISNPFTSYLHFGTNIVFWAEVKDHTLSIHSDILNKEVEFSHFDIILRDSSFIYSNINPDFFDGWHLCPDSIYTIENIAKVKESGYGYLFRGKIYSAAETEKYWNIIEQYKLRN